MRLRVRQSPPTFPVPISPIRPTDAVFAVLARDGYGRLDHPKFTVQAGNVFRGSLRDPWEQFLNLRSYRHQAQEMVRSQPLHVAGELHCQPREFGTRFLSAPDLEEGMELVNLGGLGLVWHQQKRADDCLGKQFPQNQNRRTRSEEHTS